MFGAGPFRVTSRNSEPLAGDASDVLGPEKVLFLLSQVPRPRQKGSQIAAGSVYEAGE
jgi:hypothetical protein